MLFSDGALFANSLSRFRNTFPYEEKLLIIKNNGRWWPLYWNIFPSRANYVGNIIDVYNCYQSIWASLGVLNKHNRQFVHQLQRCYYLSWAIRKHVSIDMMFLRVNHSVTFWQTLLFLHKFPHMSYIAWAFTSKK